MKKYDAALLLGLKLNEDGTPKEELRLRVQEAVRVYREHKVRYMIPCGGQTEGMPVSEAVVMKNLLVEAGVPEDVIWLEDASQITTENIQNAKTLLQQKGITKPSVLVVTSDYHGFRATFMARHMGMKARKKTCKTPAGKEKWYKRIMEGFYFINYITGWESGKRKRPKWYDKGMNMLIRKGTKWNTSK